MWKTTSLPNESYIFLPRTFRPIHTITVGFSLESQFSGSQVLRLEFREQSRVLFPFWIIYIWLRFIPEGHECGYVDRPFSPFTTDDPREGILCPFTKIGRNFVNPRDGSIDSTSHFPWFFYQGISRFLCLSVVPNPLNSEDGNISTGGETEVQGSYQSILFLTGSSPYDKFTNTHRSSSRSCGEGWSSTDYSLVVFGSTPLSNILPEWYLKLSFSEVPVPKFLMSPSLLSPYTLNRNFINDSDRWPRLWLTKSCPVSLYKTSPNQLTKMCLRRGSP